MKVQTEMNGDVAILAVAGEFVADSAVKFKEAARQAQDNGTRDFVIDLDGITSIDSIGLEALAEIQQQCEEQLGMIRFCRADDSIRKIFEITRLDQRFSIVESRDEALASFV